MALDNLPVWTFRPNWNDGVKETLGWLNAVLQSRSGAEQRIQLRHTPRRTWEVDFLLSGRDRTMFDIANNRVGIGQWYVPNWPMAANLEVAVIAGQSVFKANTRNREFRVGDAFVVMGRDQFQYDLLEIASISDDQIVSVTPASADWQAGAKVFPTRRGKIVSQSGISRLSASAAVVTVQLQQQNPEDFTDPYEGFGSYRGFNVLLERPNEADALSYSNNRTIITLDNSTGETREYDPSGINFSVQSFNAFLAGAEAQNKFRRLLYALRGRMMVLWLPTYMDDLEVLQDIHASDTSITVAECGYTAFGGPNLSREDIILRLRDGTFQFAHITNSTHGGGTETLYLESAFGIDIATDDIRQVSFMSLSRLNGDTIEIDHITDLDGLATATLNFVVAPNLRSANNLPDVVFPETIMTDEICGSPPPPAFPDIVWLLAAFQADRTWSPLYSYTDGHVFTNVDYSINHTATQDQINVNLQGTDNVPQMFAVATASFIESSFPGTVKHIRPGDFSFTLTYACNDGSGHVTNMDYDITLTMKNSADSSIGPEFSLAMTMALAEDSVASGYEADSLSYQGTGFYSSDPVNGLIPDFWTGTSGIATFKFVRSGNVMRVYLGDETGLLLSQTTEAEQAQVAAFDQIEISSQDFTRYQHHILPIQASITLDWSNAV